MEFLEAKDVLPTIRERDLDPYVVITDMIGTRPRLKSVVADLRREYPRTQIVLYSREAKEKPEHVIELQNRYRLIDRYVPKSADLKELAQAVKACVAKYEEDDVLADMRQYLWRSKGPREVITVVRGKGYSLHDFYWDIARKSGPWKSLKRAWYELMGLRQLRASKLGGDHAE